jgi:hypothetical protein
MGHGSRRALLAAEPPTATAAGPYRCALGPFLFFLIFHFKKTFNLF